MSEEEATIKGLIDITIQSLFSTVRTFVDPKRQLRVGITVQVGGKIYEKSLRSPALDGDEIVPERERPEIIT